MRIVFFGNRLSLLSGHSRIAWQNARRLESLGHQVTLAANIPNLSEHHKALVDSEGYTELWKNHFDFTPDEFKVKSRRADLRSRLEPLLSGADIVHFFDMRALRSVHALFDGKIPAKTVIQVSSLPTLTLKDLLHAGPASLLRLVTRVNDLASLLAPAFYISRLIGLADNVCTTSLFLRDVLKSRYGVAAEKISVVYLGADLLDAEVPPLADHPDFVYFGWPGAIRGTLDAAGAFERLLQTQPQARCLVSTFGTSKRFGEDVMILRALRGRFAAAGVKTAGFMPDIRRQIVGARAALLPFRSPFAYAQPPVVVLESLAAGVPVISTDVGSVREMIVDGENGYIVPRGDIAAMADRMNMLLTDDALHARMSASARRTIVDRFEPRALFNRAVAMYEKIAAGGGVVK